MKHSVLTFIKTRQKKNSVVICWCCGEKFAWNYDCKCPNCGATN